ncbi:resistance to lethality of mkk1p386 overexpression [Amphichorda felina]
MGRRKIEIKAIKDDRNRSVTFLKRKGGLFKKAHELSVLCSVDVAVFVFGNNRKLYEYSSADMRDLISRYQFHGGPNEHKGPSDFNAGNDDDDDEDGDATPPRGPEGLEPQMMPPQYHGQPHAQFPQVRHHTPSASPPIPNGAVFPGHPHHQMQRSHTPQGPVVSRPGSRNDTRRMGPSMAHQGAHPGITYMPTPPIYNPPQPQPGMAPQHGSQYPYHQGPPHHQQQQQQQQPQAYMEERRPSAPPGYTTHPPPHAAPVSRAELSPPQPPQHHVPQISTTPPQPEGRLQDPQPPPPVEPKRELMDRSQLAPQPPLINTDAAIKKLPQRKSHSIFTPVEENRSILSQHLASFASEPIKSESVAAAAAANSRAHAADIAAASRTASPPQKPTSQTSPAKGRAGSASSVPDTTFTPPSRSDSFKTGAGARPRGPRLTVQIPGDGGSEPGSATAESSSPRPAESASQGLQRHNSHSSIVLPPPSPSASALLSAGATGPPNPFAKPPPQQSVTADTPASALPSRFLGNEFLPSPSSFYNDWNFRATDNNTLPSPLNFATPIGPSGPSFLREDNTAVTTSALAGNTTASTAAGAAKRKSPEFDNDEHAEGLGMSGETKRVKVE